MWCDGGSKMCVNLREDGGNADIKSESNRITAILCPTLVI